MSAAVDAPTRLLEGIREDGRPVPLAVHLDRYGELDVDPRVVVDLVEASGLRGRGGAGFPTALKLHTVRSAGRRPVVVANGAEGEPIAGKDKVLLGYAPHLVLDGAVAAARAVGAEEAIVAVPHRLLRVAKHAIGERASRLRERIALHAVAVPDSFVAGEETALVQFLDGGRALPRSVRPFERGVHGRPTLVQNVETLASLALVVRNGPEWFRSVGTAEQPGTTLVTLSGSVMRPGVYEIPIGYPLSRLLADAGGVRRPAQAFLVGGYFGTWIPASATDIPLSDAELAPYGASLGARAIVVLPEDSSGVVETARIARYLADESAGQCGPCVHGLDAVARDLAELVGRDGPIDVARLERRLEVIAGRGACRHPDGAVRLVSSALRVFEREVRLRLARGARR